MFASAPLQGHSKSWSGAFTGPVRVAAFATATASFLDRPNLHHSGGIFNSSLHQAASHSGSLSSVVSQAAPKFTLWSALRGIHASNTVCRAESNDQSKVESFANTIDTASVSEELQNTAGEGASQASSIQDVSDGTAVSTSGSSENGASSKNGSQASSQFIFKAGAAMIPHPEKAYRGGEDAYFIGDDGLSLGVADGVGGWAEVNVDPGIYSRLLMRNCKQAAKDLPPSEDRPKDILIKAHSQTDQKGSSTACLMTIEGTHLKAANVGDSGFLVMRKDKIVMRSPAQQHQFNFPYQIGGPDCGSDPPQSAESFSFDLERGDVVVLATDGVTDNVFPEEAAAIVSVIQRKGETSQVAATGLAHYASMRAESKTHMTPFAVGAQQAGFYFQGGKMDDITVVVAYVTDSSNL